MTLIYQATKKIPGGKLVRVKLTVQEGQDAIASIKIYGDFFLHPEEALTYLEKNLIGVKLDTTILQEQINKVLQEQKAAFIGLDTSDLAAIITEAFKNPA